MKVRDNFVESLPFLRFQGFKLRSSECVVASTFTDWVILIGPQIHMLTAPEWGVFVE